MLFPFPVYEKLLKYILLTERVNTGERNGKKEKEPGLSSLFQGLLSL
jgi:hypothetical protein